MFNIPIVLYSTFDMLATQTCALMNGCLIATFYLGPFAEGAGEHYVCLEDEFRDETSSDPPDTEYNCLSTVQDEKSELDGTSGIDVPEDQSNSNTDRRTADVDTTHWNRTRLHENEEQDMNNQCGYEQQKKGHASQSNECNTDHGSYLNPDVLENIIETTVGRYPQMRQTLRAVPRFFKRVVNNVPFPQIHIPELADVTDVHHLSVRKIINMKGKNSGAVNRPQLIEP